MEVIVTGSIAYDYLMRFPGKFADYLIPEELHQISVSFLVDEMTKHWGGVAANIAYTMALLGTRPKLMGTAGRDFPPYRDHLEKVGVDTSTVRQLDDVFTASFFCNTDDDNNQIASFYSGAMGRAQDYTISEAFAGIPDLVIVSPNDPLAMTRLSQECRERGIRFIYDPSQQVPRLTGEELSRDMQGSYALVVNAYEVEMISQKTGYSLDDLRRMIEIIVITHGKKGANIYLNGEISHVDAFPAKKILDPTGGGDAFRAGLMYGILQDWPLELAGQVGSLCATYALEHIGTQNHAFTAADFVKRFRTFFDDKGVLDEMMVSA